MSQPGDALIHAERVRQMASEDYKPKDDIGRENELIDAAIAYLENYRSRVQVIPFKEWAPEDEQNTEALDDLGWPWKPKYWKPTGTKRDVVKAGALLAAALDAIITAENDARPLTQSEGIKHD